MVSTGKMLAFINALGGGATAPSEVVILPETEIAAIMESPITTAPNTMPEVGAVCTVTYNGAAYDCPAVAIPAETGMAGVALGATDAMGIPGGNVTAPFVVVLFDTPMDMEGVPVYGMFAPVEEFEEGTYITLSIVQVGAASGGESAGGGVFTVRTTGSYENNAFTFDGFDKSFSEMKAAYDADKYIRVVVETSGGLHYIGQVVMAVSGDAAASFGGFALCVEIMNNPKYFNYFYFYAGDNGAIATLKAA